MHTILDVYFFGPNSVVLEHCTHSTALHEGVCDFVACILDDSVTFGSFSSGKRGGIRSASYDEDFAKNVCIGSETPYDYSFRHQEDAHEAGSVLCAALMELSRRINNVKESLDLLLDGLRLMSGVQSFLSLRDGMLRAVEIAVKDGGCKVRGDFVTTSIWDVFAEYGMGDGAVFYFYDKPETMVAKSSKNFPKAVKEVTGEKCASTIKVNGNIISHKWQGDISNQIFRINLPIGKREHFPASRFEVLIRSFDRDPRVVVSIGLADQTTRNVLTGMQPGWYLHSIGYHSDDGRLYVNHKSESNAELLMCGGEVATCAAGTVMACGIEGGDIVFWKNGQIVAKKGIASICPDGDPMTLFPTIGIDGAVLEILIPQI